VDVRVLSRVKIFYSSRNLDHPFQRLSLGVECLVFSRLPWSIPSENHLPWISWRRIWSRMRSRQRAVQSKFLWIWLWMDDSVCWQSLPRAGNRRRLGFEREVMLLQHLDGYELVVSCFCIRRRQRMPLANNPNWLQLAYVEYRIFKIREEFVYRLLWRQIFCESKSWVKFNLRILKKQ